MPVGLCEWGGVVKVYGDMEGGCNSGGGPGRIALALCFWLVGAFVEVGGGGVMWEL